MPVLSLCRLWFFVTLTFWRIGQPVCPLRDRQTSQRLRKWGNQPPCEFEGDGIANAIGDIFLVLTNAIIGSLRKRR